MKSRVAGMMLAAAVMLLGGGCAVVSGRAGDARYSGWAFGEKAASSLAGLNVTETQSVADGALVADRGVGVDQAGSRSETEITQLLGRALVAGLAVMKGEYDGAAAVMQQQPSTATFAQATTDDGTSASGTVTRYGGVPGADGVGVYGRPGCGRCQSYLRNHPAVEMINCDTYSAELQAAIKARGYTGQSVRLPVVVTSEGYTQAAQ